MAANAFDDLMGAPGSPAPAEGGAGAAAGNAFDDLLQRAPLSEMPTNQQGAPFKWRLAVGLAETPEDQAATVRNLQKQAGIKPDAEWITFGEAPGEKLSQQTGAAYQTPGTEQLALVYTNPRTKKREVFDPAGFNPFDAGDYAGAVVPAVRTGAYVAGAAGGGGAALALGQPEAVPYAAAGGGTAASQAVQHSAKPLVEYLTGVEIPDSRSSREQLLAAGLDLGAEAALPLMGGTVQAEARTAYRAFRWKPPTRFGQPEVLQALKEMAAAEGIPEEQAIRGAAPLVTRSPTIQGFYEGLSKFPRAADTIKRYADDTLDTIRRGFTRAHATAGGATERIEAGSSIRGVPLRAAKQAQGRAGLTARPLEGSGLTGYIAWRDARQAASEARVESLVGAETMADATPISQWIGGLVQRAERGGLQDSAQYAVPRELRALQADIERNGGKIGFGALRDLRERWGEKAGFGQLVGADATLEKEYRTLYAKSSEVLWAAAKGKGKLAADAWATAQRDWAQSETLLHTVRNVANADTAEAAFAAAVSGSQQGPSRLLALKQTLSPEAWDQLVSLKLWEMGSASTTSQARGSLTKAFSPSKFMANWRSMSDRSKDVLFLRGSELRKQLERLATVSASEEQSRAMENVSRTASANVFMDMLGENGMAQLTGANISVDNARMRLLQAVNPLNRMRRATAQARLMTDPDFVRWLADGGKVPMNPNGIGGHLARLRGIAMAKPDNRRGDYEQYLEGWQAMFPQTDSDAHRQAVELPPP